MSTQGSVKGCQISVLLWGGSVCIQTGWGIGNVHRMEPGSRNWVPTTLVLAPLWDVTVGELQLFSGITEILAEIERNWKCGRRILSRVMRAQYWHTQAHTHTHRERESLTFMFKQMQMCIYANILPQQELWWCWCLHERKAYRLLQEDLSKCQFEQLWNFSSLFSFHFVLQHDKKCKTALVHTSAASTVFDACLHSIKCGGLLCFFKPCFQTKVPIRNNKHWTCIKMKWTRMNVQRKSKHWL